MIPGEVAMENARNYNELSRENLDYQQDPLHIYTNEYWRARAKIAERLIKKVLSSYFSEIEPINTVLDLACGRGFFGRTLVQSFDASELWCIDVNPRQLDVANKLNSELTDVDTYEVQINLGTDPIPFSSDSVDLAMMINSIYYLENGQKLKLFKEVSRCIGSGGMFMFSIENSLYWRNTHPYFPPLTFLWQYPPKIARKVLSRNGFSKKLQKFNLHHHESAFTYLKLLKKVNAKKVTLLLTNVLEYDNKLADHSSFPFPSDVPIGVTVNSPKNEIIRFFNIFQHGSFGDRLYSNFAKFLVHLKLHRLAFLTAPRIMFLVQF